MHDIIHQLEKKREAARLGGGQKRIGHADIGFQRVLFKKDRRPVADVFGQRHDGKSCLGDEGGNGLEFFFVSRALE